MIEVCHYKANIQNARRVYKGIPFKTTTKTVGLSVSQRPEHLPSEVMKAEFPLPFLS